MGDDNYVVRDYQQRQYDQVVYDIRNYPVGGPGPGGGGGGRGNVAGWMLFFGMLGAIVGAILGGVVGAIVCGVLAGGGLWASARFLGKAGEGAPSRTSVLWSTLKGALVGAVIGAVIALGSDNMGNAMTNWAIFCGVGAGGYRLVKRNRA